MNEKLTPQQLAEILLQDPESIRPFQKAYKAFAEGKSEDTFLDFLGRFFNDYDVVTNMEFVYAALFILAAEDALMQNPVVRAIDAQSKSMMAARTFEKLSSRVREGWLKYTTLEREIEVTPVSTEVGDDIRNHNFRELVRLLGESGNEGQINQTLRMTVGSLGTNDVEKDWFLQRLMNEALIAACNSSGVCIWLVSNCDLMGYVTEALESFRTQVYLPEAEQRRSTTMAVTKLFNEQARQKIEGLEDGVEGSIDALFDHEIDPDLD